MRIITLHKTSRVNDIISIGVFDGIHKGHQVIINKMNLLSEENNWRSCLLTFDPHPSDLVRNENDYIPMLSCTDEKIKLAALYGVHNIAVVNFTHEIADLTPYEFIHNFLIKKFKPKYVIVGEDFRFGKKRTGGIDTLKTLGRKDGFQVEAIPDVKEDGERISSTLIRRLIQKGEIKKAQKFLGRPYKFSGRVIEGLKIARELGFPTANLKMLYDRKLVPPKGIYACLAHWSGNTFPAALYIGHRPTLVRDEGISVEVHVINQEGLDLYGKIIEVSVLEKLREDKHFSDKTILKNQIKEDISSVEKFFFEISE